MTKIVSVQSLVLSFSTLLALGCHQSLENEPLEISSQGLLESCVPSEGYNDCALINLGTSEYWQDQVSNSSTVPWRKTVVAEGKSYDYSVIIDAEQLNGGLILTADGQGHYSSVSEYADAYYSLIGVPPDSTVSLIIKNDSAKVMLDGDKISTGSTGDFIFDALSDENGDVFVNGENVRDLLISAEEVSDYDIIYDGELITNNQGLTLISGQSTAEYNAFRTNSIFQKWLGSKAKNLRYKDKKAYWYRVGWGRWRRENYKADIYIRNEYYTGSGYPWLTEFADGDNVTSLKESNSSWKNGNPKGVHGFVEIFFSNAPGIMYGDDTEGTTP